MAYCQQMKKLIGNVIATNNLADYSTLDFEIKIAAEIAM